MNQPENNILDKTKALLAESPYISFKDFKRLRNNNNSGEVSVKHLHELLKLVAEQSGYWESVWYFSPTESPNQNAQSEVEGWNAISETVIKSLGETVPETKETILEEHNLIRMQQSLIRRVEYNSSRPVEKIITAILSKVSFLMNDIGFKSIAHRLYINSLYPKGTVGRT